MRADGARRVNGAACTGPTGAANAGPAWVHGRPVVMVQGGDPGEQAVSESEVVVAIGDDADGADRQATELSRSQRELGGTTFFRQDECGAKTPWKRMSGWCGGEMRAASRARNCTMGLARPGFADRVCDTSVPEHAQPFEAQRRPGTVAQEPLSPLAITRRHDDTGMHVEPSRVATVPVRSRRDGQRHVVGAEKRGVLRWQSRQLPESERALQTGVERRRRRGTVGSVDVLIPEKTSAAQPRRDLHLHVEGERFEIGVVGLR